MKLKILKDIPGFKKDSIVEFETDSILIFSDNFALPNKDEESRFIKYPVEMLIQLGFVEEMENKIDIEDIREDYKRQTQSYDPRLIGNIRLSQPEIDWVTSYRIVEAVIRKLNGNWQIDWNKSVSERKYLIQYDFRSKEFYVTSTGYHMETIFLSSKTKKIAEKVIELCQPELKILFKIK